MDWITILLAAGLVIGVAAGTMLVVRSPVFWVGLGQAVAKAALPAIIAVILKRKPPAEEQAWRDCQRRGGRWNHLKKRCE